jgi:predicted DNA-binding transcriptional regulator AlpA
MSSDSFEYLTAEEVAGMFRISVSALYTQRHRNEAPGILGQKVGRKLLWRRSEIDAWWEAQRGQVPM